MKHDAVSMKQMSRMWWVAGAVLLALYGWRRNARKGV